jgi:UDP-3-O-[3-hydroxymyristoyl] glucosamine N-acyltransferase
VISLGRLAERLDGRLLDGDPESEIGGVSTLRDASPAQVCYYGNRRYRKYLSTTSAAAVIVSDPVETSAGAQILVDDAYVAFREALRIFAPDRRSGFSGVHPTAVVHETARLGDDVEVGPHAVLDREVAVGAGSVIGSGCHLGPGCTLGRECLLYPSVCIGADVVLGERVIVHPGAVLGGDGFGFVPRPDGRHLKVPQNGTVRLGDDVEVGAGCTVDRAVAGETVIGAHTKLDNLVHVAHNVRLGRGCLVAAQTGIAGSTTVGDGVVFGGQAGLVGHIEIGDGARIGAQAGVTKNVPAGTTVSGYPARPHRTALRQDAILRRLPDLYRKLLEKGGPEDDGGESGE